MMLHPQQQLIRDLVEEHGDDPVRITSIVNRFAKVLGYTNRCERDQRRIQGFQSVGQLIKGCLLEWHGSHKIRWVPLDNPGRKMLEKRWEDSVQRLPAPNLG
jgi:hypothetical protein